MLEKHRPLATLESHSYRMEAAALLSGLVYLREELKWSGIVEWHMDSQSVIDTSGKIAWSNMTHWVRGTKETERETPSASRRCAYR